MSQMINNVVEARVLLSQFFGQYFYFQPQRLRYSLSIGFAMMQQLLHFIFD